MGGDGGDQHDATGALLRNHLLRRKLRGEECSQCLIFQSVDFRMKSFGNSLTFTSSIRIVSSHS